MNLVHRDIATIIHNAHLFHIWRSPLLDDQIARSVDELFELLEFLREIYADIQRRILRFRGK